MGAKLAKSKEELEKAIRETVGEINELLAKSGHMMNDAKEASQSEDHGAEKMEKADPDMGGEGPLEEEYESPDEADAEMDMGGEMGDDLDMEGEGAGEGDEMAEMQEFVSALEDDQLDMMLEYLTQEKEQRAAAGMEGEGGDMAPAPEGDTMVEDPEMDKAYKDDYLKLHKSLKTVVGSIEKLTQAVGAINTKVDGLEKSKKKVASKAAVARRSDALEKSAPAPKTKERLNKSQTEEFLMNQIRQRNPLVDRRAVLDLTYVKTDEELANFQDNLTRQGLKFPEL